LTVIRIVEGVLTNIAQTAIRPHNDWIVVDDNFSLPMGSKVTVTYDINNKPIVAIASEKQGYVGALDYTKMKRAELMSLGSERGIKLSTTMNIATMISAHQEYDKENELNGQ
jgi:hypothetical protein